MDLQVTTETESRAAASAVCLINKLRRRRGMRALQDSSQLRRGPQQHAHDMVDGQYFSHVSENGRTLSARTSATDDLQGYPTWRIGENLAWGTGAKSSAKRIVQSWMLSPPHKRNLLNPRYREAGLAVVYGSPATGTTGAAGTYVHEFGRRSG
jgi:uncharacterized protein YkwD